MSNQFHCNAKLSYDESYFLKHFPIFVNEGIIICRRKDIAVWKSSNSFVCTKENFMFLPKNFTLLAQKCVKR